MCHMFRIQFMISIIEKKTGTIKHNNEKKTTLGMEHPK